MNKYEINPMLIHVKEKNKLCMQIMLLFWLCKTHTPTLNGIVSWIRRQSFLEKSDENKAGKCRFLAWFDKFKVHFCKIIVYEHYSYKKDVWTALMLSAWTLFIALGFASVYKQSFMHSIPLMNS